MARQLGLRLMTCNITCETEVASSPLVMWGMKIVTDHTEICDKFNALFMEIDPKHNESFNGIDPKFTGKFDT